MKARDDKPPPIAPFARLGVAHLLLWTFFTAGVAGVQEALRDRTGGPESVHVVWHLVQLVYAMTYGAALTGLWVYISRRLRGITMQLAPGHYMVLLGAATALADGGVFALVQITLKPWVSAYDQDYVCWLLHQTIGFLIVGSLWTLWLPWMRLAGRWRLGFVLLALLMLTQGLANLWMLLEYYGVVSFAAPLGVSWMFPYWWMLVGSSICVVVLVALVIWDALEETFYDWLHWTGIIVSIALAAMEWAQFVRMIMLP